MREPTAALSEYARPHTSRMLLALGWLVLAGCSRGDSGWQADVTESRVALNTNPQTTQFAVYAKNSAILRDRVVLSGGDVGVQLAGTGPFVGGAYELMLSSDAQVDTTHSVIANRLQLLDRARVGDIQVNQLANQNGSYTHKYAFPASMPALPPLAAVSPGTSALTVPSSTSVSSNPGSFGAVSIGYRGVWRIQGGVYHLASLQLDNEARIEALAPVQLRVAGRLIALDRVFVGAATGATLVAGDLRIEISGQNGGSGSLADTPKAASFGNDPTLRAVLLVPGGTLDIGQRGLMVGAFVAREVAVGIDSHITYQGGVGPSGCLRSCDDGDTSTVDTCSVGTCTHTLRYCATVTAALCADFEDGNATNPAWTIGDQAASTDFAVINDGGFVYRQGNSSSAARRTATVGDSLTNTVAQARFKILATNGTSSSVGLFARYDANANTGYILSVRRGSGPAGTAAISIARKDPGANAITLSPTWPNTSPDQQVTLDLQSWYTLGFVAKGAVLTGYLNGNRVIEAVDLNYASGRIGVGSTGTATFEVDNVTAGEETASVQAFLDSRYTAADVRHVFQTNFGETIDCVDYFAQSALKTLAAMGYATTTLPTPPTQDPSQVSPSNITFNGQPDSSGRSRACPSGSVPMARITAGTIAAMGGLDAFFAARGKKTPPPAAPPPAPPATCPPPGTPIPGYAHVVRIFTNTPVSPDLFPHPFVEYHSTMSIHSPATQGQSHSLAQIWILNGTGFNNFGCTCTGDDCIQSLEAGWTVDAYQNRAEPHPESPHLFSYSTNDGYHGGCYNYVGPPGTSCMPFLSLPDAKYAFPLELEAASANAAAKELYVQISYSDGKTLTPLPGWVLTIAVDGNWSHVGYWPSGFFTGGLAAGYGTMFEVGGEIYDEAVYNGLSTTWGTMGSGVSPLTDLTHAAYHKNFCACTTNDCYAQCLEVGTVKTEFPDVFTYVVNSPGTINKYLYYGNIQ